MDKDLGIKLAEVISRIRAIRLRRKAANNRNMIMKKMYHEKMFDIQSKGRMFRDSLGASAGTKAPAVTFDTIQDADGELAGSRSFKPTPKFLTLNDPMNGNRHQSYSMGFSVVKDRDPGPIEWKLNTEWNMNMISLVSDPEPDGVFCKQEDNASAFDYAMKFVEK